MIKNTALFVLLILVTRFSYSHQNQIRIEVSRDLRCFIGNGLPDHGTGSFPNRGNPNAISQQDIHLCVDAKPVKKLTPTKNHRGSVGIALNGVQFRPGTAEYFDAHSPRGFSRDPGSGWNLEGLGARELLGMDQHNAHVDGRGLYHYHGMTEQLIHQDDSLVGYAADGFEIHFAGYSQTSSYRLRNGLRPEPPGGRYDGTYLQDWEYREGSGTLDQCNGGVLEGRFVYFATESFPFFPRCFWGEVSNDFRIRRDSLDQQSLNRQGRGRKPPAAAIESCRYKETGQSCYFQSPRGHTVSGICRKTPDQITACVPDRRQ